MCATAVPYCCTITSPLSDHTSCCPPPPQGYSTGKPEGRMRGVFGYIGNFTLLGTVFKFAWDLLSSK